jgi:hypothetical protein
MCDKYCASVALHVVVGRRRISPTLTRSPAQCVPCNAGCSDRMLRPCWKPPVGDRSRLGCEASACGEEACPFRLMAEPGSSAWLPGLRAPARKLLRAYIATKSETRLCPDDVTALRLSSSFPSASRGDNRDASQPTWDARQLNIPLAVDGRS